MALLHDSVERKRLDVRMVERNISRGVLSRDEFEKSMKKLPDDQENALWISIQSLADDGTEVENGKAR